ncbi:ComF family protein [Cupriavidus basilensis]
MVCRDCANELLYPVSRCPVCAMGVVAWPAVHGVRAAPTAFDQAFTLGDYAIPAGISLVLALKYDKVLPLAGWLATALAHRVRAAFQAGAAQPDLLAPIPLSPQRLAARGFNQAWEIARPLARHLGIASDPGTAGAPARHRHPTLAGPGPTPDERARRVFAWLALSRWRACAVGLVDDVMTTGATLDERRRAR